MTSNISSYSPIIPVHSPCSPMPVPTTPSPSSPDLHLTPQRRRRKVPCMDLIQGTQMAAELAKKAMALIVCCLMLTMGSKQVSRTAASTASCSPQSSCPPSGASSPKRKSESMPHSGAFSQQSHAHHTFNASAHTNPNHSQQSTSSNSTHQRKTVPPIGKGTFDSSINRPSYYETLLVSSVASPAEIKASHRRLAIRYHPDKVSQRLDKSGRPALSAAQCQAMFIRVQEAYEVLSDPEERRRYDTALAMQTRYRKLGKGLSNGDDTPEPYSASTNPSYSPFSTSSNASYGSPSPMPSSVNASRRTSWDSSFPGWKNATAPRPSRLNALLRCIYVAVPLALFKVFVLRPLATLAPRAVDALPNYTARVLKAVKKRVHAVLSIPSSVREWLSATYSLLTQWSWLQLFSWSLSLMVFSTLYVPFYCMRRWRQVKRTVFNLINGENVQEEDEWPSWMDKFKSPPTPGRSPVAAATAKTRSSIPIRVQSKSDSSDPSVATTASEASDSSTPSLSASASASSMSSTDGTTPRHSTTTLPTAPKVRSLSESEYEGSDEEWSAQVDLTPVSHSHRSNGSTVNSEGMKKSRSMPFTAHQRDYN